jgi:hypothetical protein
MSAAAFFNLTAASGDELFLAEAVRYWPLRTYYSCLAARSLEMEACSGAKFV